MTNKIIKVFLFVVFFSFANNSMAQKTRAIFGVVVEAGTGAGISEAQVSIVGVGQDITTTTGQFRIFLPYSVKLGDSVNLVVMKKGWRVLSAVSKVTITENPESAPIIVIMKREGAEGSTRNSASQGRLDYGELKLVDVSFIDTKEFPQIDVKVRNVGSKVAFIKRAVFKVSKVWTFKLPQNNDAYAATWNYDLMLPIKRTPYVQSLDISQKVDTNAVDRFTFTIGNNSNQGTELYAFLMTMEIIYDEDDKILRSHNLLFRTKSSYVILGFSTYPKEGWDSVMTENKRIAKEIEVYKGIYSAALKDWLKFLDELLIE
jgi:hypothetical protein